MNEIGIPQAIDRSETTNISTRKQSLFVAVFDHPFSTNVALLYPVKTLKKPGGFLMFSGDIEVEDWLNMC